MGQRGSCCKCCKTERETATRWESFSSEGPSSAITGGWGIIPLCLKQDNGKLGGSGETLEQEWEPSRLKIRIFSGISTPLADGCVRNLRFNKTGEYQRATSITHVTDRFENDWASHATINPPAVLIRKKDEGRTENDQEAMHSEPVKTIERKLHYPIKSSRPNRISLQSHLERTN
ncbi:predicted protein [Histoplasma capsulatum H143]|uniref:Uncharacterized protein n=1 Tax=Ajellomyces capsulatus (strain H143) TaxID=544712 RepID=C6H6W9_AJECH|nr:predicted protein [Histoplasma capsulatum H143]